MSSIHNNKIQVGFHILYLQLMETHIVTSMTGSSDIDSAESSEFSTSSLTVV